MKLILPHLRIGGACNWLRPNVFPFVSGICFFLFFPVSTLAQDQFAEQTSISLPGVYQSSVAWGDYDNDGDLDVLLTGDTGSGFVSMIYRNNGDNTFTEQTSIFLALD